MKQRDIYIKRENLPEHLLISQEDVALIIQKKVVDLRAYFRKYGYTKAVVGLSGGIDSALSAALFARAMGGKNLIVVRLPYGKLFSEGIEEAGRIALSLGVPQKNILTIPITEAVDASWRNLKKISGGKRGIRLGNIMARERMKVLFDLSSAWQAVVLGTENKTEHYLAYYTIGGDHVSGVEPIFDLWKTQVYQLAANIEEIPDFVLKKVPSAGFWKGQSDEGEIGATYLEIDIVLSAHLDLGFTRSDIRRKFKIPYSKIDLVLERLRKTEGKRNLPYILGKKDTVEEVVKKLIRVLKKKELFLGIMESCTGGGLANAITNVPGASEIIKGALVTYSNEEKIAHGVPANLIKKYSVYSPEVSLAMAEQAREKVSCANIGVGVTGRFDGRGVVYAAVVFGDKKLVRKFYFPDPGERPATKAMAIRKILEMILEIL